MRHANLELNDKWTALQTLHGWQHFRIVTRRYDGKLLQIELMAACDASVRFWLAATDLKDRQRFAPGWTRLVNLPQPAEQALSQELASGTDSVTTDGSPPRVPAAFAGMPPVKEGPPMTPKIPDQLTRRDAVALGVGYALAVSPATAFAVSTPDHDLQTATVLIPTGPGGKEQLPAYTASPKKAGTYPCIIVVQEIFGVHEYIRDVCRRLAKAGYFAVAPSLYFRQGDPTKVESIDLLLKTIVSKVPQATVLSDLDAVVAWAHADPRGKDQPMGLTGFCWGGNAAWMYAAHNPKLKAAVAWYGRLTGDKSDMSPRFPIDAASTLTVPVLGLYGELDKGIPVADITAMRAALAKGKSGSKIIVYPGAEHGFHADYRPSYQAKAAEAGWQELLTWFKEHGLKA